MSEAEVVRRAFRVTGRVQGVGFRWWTRREGSRLGLGGWVRNEPDGSVVVHVVGPAGAVEELGRQLWKGPAASRVATREEIVPTGDLPRGQFRVET